MQADNPHPSPLPEGEGTDKTPLPAGGIVLPPPPLGEGRGESSSRFPQPEQLTSWREKLDCGFPQIANVFEDCMVEAQTALTPEGMDAYLEQARFLGKMGRGVEPVLIFLQEWPQVARILGESALPVIMDADRAIWFDGYVRTYLERDL